MYLVDETRMAEAVEAGARAAVLTAFPDENWSEWNETDRDEIREQIRAAIFAAYPILVSEITEKHVEAIRLEDWFHDGNAYEIGDSDGKLRVIDLIERRARLVHNPGNEKDLPE